MTGPECHCIVYVLEEAAIAWDARVGLQGRGLRDGNRIVDLLSSWEGVPLNSRF